MGASMARPMAPIRPAKCEADSSELRPRAPTWAATILNTDKTRRRRWFSAENCRNSLTSMTGPPDEIASLDSTGGIIRRWRAILTNLG
jgi:hypothetical protein